MGVTAIYMGLHVDLQCLDTTLRDNLLASLPLLVFGTYSLATALFLWQKPSVGNILVVITITMALILFLASIFDLSLPIIKTSCLIV